MTSGNNPKYFMIVILQMINTGNITMKPNKKLTKFDTTIETGIIALGMVNCLSKPTFCFIVVALSDKAPENKNHGKSALSTNKENAFISVFITWVNTKLTATLIKSGVNTAQDMPKIEPAYFALN